MEDQEYDLVKLSQSWVKPGCILVLNMSHYRDCPVLNANITVFSNLPKVLQYLKETMKRFDNLQFTSKNPITFEFFGMEESVMRIVLHGLTFESIEDFISENKVEILDFD